MLYDFSGCRLLSNSLWANKVFRKQILFVGTISFASLINICFAPFFSEKKKTYTVHLKFCLDAQISYRKDFNLFFLKFGHDACPEPSEIECESLLCQLVYKAGLLPSQCLALGGTLGKEKRYAAPAEETRSLCSAKCYSGWEGQGEGSRECYFGVV